MSDLADFRTFLDSSPSSFHAAATAAARLDQDGFVRFDLADPAGSLPAGTRGYVLRGGSIVAFHIGQQPAIDAGLRIVAAHTDSPNLRLKPRPLIRGNGWVRLGLEPYGGVLLATWTDRDLGIAGRVAVRDGLGHRHALVAIRRPICRVANLAIHLNRGVNDEGLKLNAQTQLPAVFALENDDSAGDPVRRLLAAEIGCAEVDVLTWDLGTFDLTPAAIGGVNGEFLFSARLDNLASCHAALAALQSTLDGVPASTSVIALFDHEEIGSRTSRGADGRLLEAVLGRILGPDNTPTGLTRALEKSFLVSADMSHAVHPGFADKSEPEHMPKLNAGPVIKQHTSWRYSTEGDGAATFALACERAGVVPQWYVHRSDLACGSTVGPMVAADLGIRSVDVGNPMLSMHSAREMCGTADHPLMIRALAEVLRG